jgi:hypothetical protein
MRPQVLFLAAGLIAGALAIGACTSGDGDDLGFCFLDEQRQRDLEVQAGAEPRFSWCGAPAQTLTVRAAQGQAVFWRLECVNDVRCIFPPTTYAQEPTDVPPQEVTAGPLDLLPGASYEVCVSQIVPVEATLCTPFTR